MEGLGHCHFKVTGVEASHAGQRNSGGKSSNPGSGRTWDRAQRAAQAKALGDFIGHDRREENLLVRRFFACSGPCSKNRSVGRHAVQAEVRIL